MGSSPFRLKSSFKLSGDQPEAVDALHKALERGENRLVLQGVTGSGKTFTLANLIEKWGRPTLVLSHNKTLAAQLYSELKGFFPDNAVEYFISYYDYYQPEAYIPQTDTYIEKDAAINEEIERYRLAATNALIGRRDVIVVASVSCIYGLGESDEYRDLAVGFRKGEAISRDALAKKLVEAQYARNDFDFSPGVFRMRGDVLDIFPAYETKALRVMFFGDEIDAIRNLDPLTGKATGDLPAAVVTPAKQFVMGKDKLEAAFARIEAELDERLRYFESKGKLLEAQRLKERTEYDIEMMRTLGYCNGIENYSRPLSGRAPGSAPECLIDYFPDDFLTIIDESHVSLPQLRAMYNGDQARKQKLVDYGFRLPSAKDNRPLKFEEFAAKTRQIVFVSATPGDWEYSESSTVAEQILRPTGLLDPTVEIRPLAGQIDDLIEEIRKTAKAGDRAFVTTLTKKSAEDLTDYLRGTGIRVEYLHSDISAIDRVDILKRLRKGDFDVLVGINLLREGLDLPEVALVAILDADKEGFLRSTTSLVQTAGRAARHEKGRVILYADHETDAIRDLVRIAGNHRKKQMEYNKLHGIAPKSVKRAINEASYLYSSSKAAAGAGSKAMASGRKAEDAREIIEEMKREMLEAADNLEFEKAAYLRDKIKDVEKTIAAKSRDAGDLSGKAALRREMKTRRKGFPADAKAAADAAICEKLMSRRDIGEAVDPSKGGSPVAVYLASPDEIDIDSFIGRMLRAGVEVVAPRWNGETYELARLKGLGARNLRRGPMGIREPARGDVVEPGKVFAWIVPGLAFTRGGKRLGYGGGWYDRFLSSAPEGAIKIGVAYSFQVVDDLPSDPHDMAVTEVVDDSSAKSKRGFPS